MHPETVKELESRAEEGVRSFSRVWRNETGTCDVCFRDASPTVESEMVDEHPNGRVIWSTRETCRECFLKLFILFDTPGFEFYNGDLEAAD